MQSEPEHFRLPSGLLKKLPSSGAGLFWFLHEREATYRFKKRIKTNRRRTAVEKQKNKMFFCMEYAKKTVPRTI